MTMPLQR